MSRSGVTWSSSIGLPGQRCGGTDKALEEQDRPLMLPNPMSEVGATVPSLSGERRAANGRKTGNAKGRKKNTETRGNQRRALGEKDCDGEKGPWQVSAGCPPLVVWNMAATWIPCQF